MTFVRPDTATLVLTDGTRIVVRNPTDPEAGRGADALNDRLAALRDDHDAREGAGGPRQPVGSRGLAGTWSRIQRATRRADRLR